MIAFLTLLYCAVLFALVRLGVIRLTTWWKLSPAVWLVPHTPIPNPVPTPCC